MKYVKYLVILLILVPSTVNAFEINFFGINVNDLSDKSLPQIMAGAIVSLAVHEIGHYVIAEANGGGSFDISGPVVIAEDYNNMSSEEQQMFHRAGFLAQLIVGGTLTIIPQTSNSDFTAGFNGFTTVNTTWYTLSGGKNPNTSDIEKLNYGITEGAIYSQISYFLLSKNLK